MAFDVPETKQLIKCVCTWLFLFLTFIASCVFLYLQIEVEIAKLVFCALFGAVVGGKPINKKSASFSTSFDSPDGGRRGNYVTTTAAH